MKTVLRWGTVLGLSLFVGTVAHAEINLLTNGGFDAGTIAGWTMWELNAGTASVEFGSYGSPSGTAVQLNNSGTEQTTLYQVVDVPAGKSVWASVDAMRVAPYNWTSFLVYNMADTTSFVMNWSTATNWGTVPGITNVYDIVNWGGQTDTWLHSDRGPFTSLGRVAVVLHNGAAPPGATSRWDNVQLFLPEPSTLALAGLAAAALGLRRRR